MKTAEEMIDDIQRKHSMGPYEFVDWKDCINLMKEYAKQACKEQRKICKNQVRGFSKAEDKILVYTAPKPDLK